MKYYDDVVVDDGSTLWPSNDKVQTGFSFSSCSTRRRLWSFAGQSTKEWYNFERSSRPLIVLYRISEAVIKNKNLDIIPYAISVPINW